MKHSKTVHTPRVVVPERDKTSFSHTTCDLCEKETKNEVSKYDGELDWDDGSNGNYTIYDVNVSVREGNDYGTDGADWVTEWVEVCPSCLRDKVFPALEALGLTVYKGNHDR